MAEADLARRACGGLGADGPLQRTAVAEHFPESRLVVVVDQFEEVFTSCSDEAERSAFIAALGATALGGPADPADPAATLRGNLPPLTSPAARRSTL